MVPHYQDSRQRVASDAEFARRIEAVLPAGSMVYEMPYVPFPESAPVQNLTDYELARPAFHTRTLRWSYGAMKGRDVSRWQADLATRPLPDVMRRLAFVGFRGVYLDRAGFADAGAATEAELSRVLGVQPLVSLSGRQSFFDMTAYADALRVQCTDAQWQAKRESALHPVEVRWKRGETFCVQEQAADPADCKWFSSQEQLLIHNTGRHPRRVVLKMEYAGWQAAPAPLVLAGDLTRQELTLTQEPRPVELNLLVPPGDHVLTFSCDGPRMPAPGDPREIVYQMEKFECHVED
jgi:phosphoglycerol transferase